MDITIPGIDTNAGIKQCGSVELYLQLLRDVYGIIDKKSAQVEDYLNQGDQENYTIMVHSLKTTCRMLGHTALSQRFYELEQLGKEGALDQAAALTPAVLADFRSLKVLLEPYVPATEEGTLPYSPEAIQELLTEIEAATADYDVDRAEAAAAKLLNYRCDAALSMQLQRLATLVSELDYADAAALAASL